MVRVVQARIFVFLLTVFIDLQAGIHCRIAEDQDFSQATRRIPASSLCVTVAQEELTANRLRSFILHEDINCCSKGIQADPRSDSCTPSFPLLEAVRYNRAHNVRLLLRHGASLHQENDMCLALAVNLGHYAVTVELLLHAMRPEIQPYSLAHIKAAYAEISHRKKTGRIISQDKLLIGALQRYQDFLGAAIECEQYCDLVIQQLSNYAQSSVDWEFGNKVLAEVHLMHDNAVGFVKRKRAVAHAQLENRKFCLQTRIAHFKGLFQESYQSIQSDPAACKTNYELLVRKKYGKKKGIKLLERGKRVPLEITQDPYYQYLVDKRRYEKEYQESVAVNYSPDESYLRKLGDLIESPLLTERHIQFAVYKAVNGNKSPSSPETLPGVSRRPSSVYSILSDGRKDSTSDSSVTSLGYFEGETPGVFCSGVVNDRHEYEKVFDKTFHAAIAALFLDKHACPTKLLPNKMLGHCFSQEFMVNQQTACLWIALTIGCSMHESKELLQKLSNLYPSILDDDSQQYCLARLQELLVDIFGLWQQA